LSNTEFGLQANTLREGSGRLQCLGARIGCPCGTYHQVRHF
jgi:hypothetical protein